MFDSGAVGDTEQGQARLLGGEHNKGKKEEKKMNKGIENIKTILTGENHKGLQMVIAAAVNRSICNDGNIIASYKEYIDCGSWTTQC